MVFHQESPSIHPAESSTPQPKAPALERGVTGFARASSVDLSQISFTKSKHFRSGSRPCACYRVELWCKQDMLIIAVINVVFGVRHCYIFDSAGKKCFNIGFHHVQMAPKTVELWLFIPAKYELIPLIHPCLLVKS